jgi:hypothetical protein
VPWTDGPVGLGGDDALLVNAASDPDGDTLTIDPTPVTAPARGTLVLTAGGSVAYGAEYKPGGLSNTSTVTFSYRVLDGNGGSVVCNVEITICEQRARGRARGLGRARAAGARAACATGATI